MMENITQEKNGTKNSLSRKLIRVDMTPMVDLGFLLITFFMFTTNFSKPNILNLSLPAKTPINNTNDIDLTNSITFIIGKDNRVFYHQKDKAGLNVNTLKEVSFDSFAIAKTLEEAKKNAKKPEIFTVILKPTDDANYKNFVDLIDEMAITKSERFGIADIKPFEKEILKEKF